VKADVRKAIGRVTPFARTVGQSSHHHDSPSGEGVVRAGADRRVPQPEQGRDSTVIETEVTHTPFQRTLDPVREPRRVRRRRYWPTGPTLRRAESKSDRIRHVRWLDG
jgi:hypothetical protein